MQNKLVVVLLLKIELILRKFGFIDQFLLLKQLVYNQLKINFYKKKILIYQIKINLYLILNRYDGKILNKINKIEILLKVGLLMLGLVVMSSRMV